jgi:hypothetical protein
VVHLLLVLVELASQQAQVDHPHIQHSNIASLDLPQRPPWAEVELEQEQVLELELDWSWNKVSNISRCGTSGALVSSLSSPGHLTD